MSDTKHPAEVLADSIATRHAVTTDAIEFWLRRVPALEAEIEAARAQRDKFAWREAHMGDRCDALTAERDQLRAQVEALRAELSHYRPSINVNKI